MQEDSTWEGQGFTLVLFVCVVVLCSVFFVLGMLAGRSQASVAADIGAETPGDDAGGGTGTADPARDLTFYESVADGELPGLEAFPDSEAPGIPGPPVSTEVTGGSGPAPPLGRNPGETAITLQVGALANADQARSLSEDLVDKGFPAFVLRPGPDDAVALNRVQVGPFNDAVEAAAVRRALEAEGFAPIVVR